MKKTVLFSFLALSAFAFFFTSCENEPVVGPMEYHDDIIFAYTELDNQIYELSSAIWDTTYTVEDLVDEYELCENIIEHNLSDLQETKKLVDDPGFLESVIDFYESVDKTLNNEYSQILSFYEGEWEDSYGEQIDDLDSKAVDMLIEKEDIVINQQKRFANAYGIDLED